MKNQNEIYPVDILVSWVDGNDPEWLAEKTLYSPSEIITDDRELRYRDWDNLRYLFRGIEKYASWVNKVFFVTWGHLPKWLNKDAPNLRIINNEDYIPAEYNPTFSSHTKEINFHRIKELSEHFIYFNDDMFLLRKTRREDFFRNGKPCDCAILTAHSHNEAEPYMFFQYRATGILNKYFDIKEVIRKKRSGWYNLKYGKMLFRSWVLSGFPRFTGIWQQHLPFCILKSTMEELWEKEYESLHQTSLNRFRSMSDYNIWVFRNWQLASGNFYPRGLRAGNNFNISDEQSLNNVTSYIEKQKRKMICINDSDMSEEEFIKAKNALIGSFESILPDKSKYEL